MKYIEKDFPIEKLNEIARKEGNAKKPIYQIHKWWARRLGSVFRTILLTSFLPDEITEEEFWENYYYKKNGFKRDIRLFTNNLGPIYGRRHNNSRSVKIRYKAYRNRYQRILIYFYLCPLQ